MSSVCIISSSCDTTHNGQLAIGVTNRGNHLNNYVKYIDVNDNTHFYERMGGFRNSLTVHLQLILNYSFAIFVSKALAWKYFHVLCLTN